LVLVALSTTCRLCKDDATLPWSQEYSPYSAYVHCSVHYHLLMLQPQPEQLTTAAAIATFM
jgi:hypothetical protein